MKTVKTILGIFSIIIAPLQFLIYLLVTFILLLVNVDIPTLLSFSLVIGILLLITGIFTIIKSNSNICGFIIGGLYIIITGVSFYMSLNFTKLFVFSSVYLLYALFFIIYSIIEYVNLSKENKIE